MYQDIKLGGGSYEHEKMVSFVLTNRIYDVGFAGNVRESGCGDNHGSGEKIPQWGILESCSSKRSSLFQL